MSSDLNALREENAKLRGALLTIARGSANGAHLFTTFLGGRSYPTWYAVNALQDHLSAAKGTAERALGIDPVAVENAMTNVVPV